MPDTLTPRVRIFLWGVVALSLGAQVGGLFLPLIEPDEALYAIISRELSSGKTWAALTLHGEAWLDKPHFPFWCAALSMRLFGPTSLAYRIPGFLFYMMGVAYVYWSGRRFFEPGVAPWAAVVTLTAYHLVFSNHDVRAEPYLVGLVTGALFHLAAAGETRRLGHAAAAGLLAGASIITKGPFLVFSTAGAAVLASLLTKRWPTWGQVTIFTVALLGPVGAEMTALALQHGDTSSTALRAILSLFWDGQVNRLLQSGSTVPEAGPLYYVHTLVWAFAPWFPTLAVFTVGGVYALTTGGRIRAQFTQASQATQRSHASFARLTFFSSAALTFVLFSATRFQLPYYLNFEMPMLALMVATVIVRPARARERRLASALQFVLTGALLVAVAAGLVLAEVPHRWAAMALLGLPFAVLAVRDKEGVRAWVFSAAAGSAAALALNFGFYPWLLQFEAGYNAGRTLPTHDETHVFSVGYISYAYDFYASPRVQMLSLEDAARWQLPEGSFLYVRAVDLPGLARSATPFDVVQRFHGTAVSQPRLPFLNPATRSRSLQETLVLRSR